MNPITWGGEIKHGTSTIEIAYLVLVKPPVAAWVGNLKMQEIQCQLALKTSAFTYIGTLSSNTSCINMPLTKWYKNRKLLCSGNAEKRPGQEIPRCGFWSQILDYKIPSFPSLPAPLQSTFQRSYCLVFAGHVLLLLDVWCVFSLNVMMNSKDILSFSQSHNVGFQRKWARRLTIIKTMKNPMPSSLMSEDCLW